MINSVESVQICKYTLFFSKFEWELVYSIPETLFHTYLMPNLIQNI